jgi:hypothetical protein
VELAEFNDSAIELLTRQTVPGLLVRPGIGPICAARDEARRDVFAYLGYYNRHRLHQTLRYRAPREVRVGYRQDLALVARNPGVRFSGTTSDEVFGRHNVSRLACPAKARQMPAVLAFAGGMIRSG